MKPQNAAILSYLTSVPGRGLSANIALTTMQVGTLSKRIAELRADGHKIIESWRKNPNGSRFKVYKLGGPDDAPSKWTGKKPIQL